jgi:hypothetical protein
MPITTVMMANHQVVRDQGRVMRKGDRTNWEQPMLKLSTSFERIAKLVLTTFLFCGAAWGADNPFVGTWKLNLAKSKFDPGPPVRSRTVTVEPAGDGVKWSIEQVDANGKSWNRS